MRFVLAAVSLLIAVVLIGFGIAQRTVLAGDDRLTATSRATSDATVTVIDGSTLTALDGRQTVAIGGSDTIFAAYGRTTDVLGWIGDASYNDIGFDRRTQDLTTEEVSGTEDAVPSPEGSDLWLREFRGENQLDLQVVLNEDLSILVVSDGTAPAPPDVSISWPLDNRTPWAGPLIAAGSAMLVLALIFFVWALLHQRRKRGPRRVAIGASRSPRMPKLPRQRTYRVPKPKAVTQTRGRRSAKRMTAITSVVLVAGVALSGCSSDLWPDIEALVPSASPSPTLSTAPVADESRPAAATVRQIDSIVRNASSVAEKADAALDGEALKARFTGPALELRVGNYAIRAKDSAYPALPAIPSDVTVTLPQQSDTWPRTIFAVAQKADDATVAPVALTLVQEAPRDQYKVVYAVTLEPDAVLPELAPEGVGAVRLSPDSTILSMPPGQLLAAYTDIVNFGSGSPSFELFDMEKDKLIGTIGMDGRAARKAGLPATASIEFGNAPGAGETIALSTNETGALVSTYFIESETVKPVEEGAKLNPEGAVKTLSGITDTEKGVTATYGDQLLFYIPPIGSTDKVVLLGFSQGLLTAKEIP